MFRQLCFADYTSVNVQVLGTEDTYGPHATNWKVCSAGESPHIHYPAVGSLSVKVPEKQGRKMQIAYLR